MKIEWIGPVQQILIAARGSGLRILGITSPRLGSGVSTLAREAAENSSRSGIRTLLVDLTASVTQSAALPSWAPGQNAIKDGIKNVRAGYDQLTLIPTAETRFLFNNTQLLRTPLDSDLSEYATVIVDLPPLLSTQSDLLSSLAAASSCDAVCVVCVTDRDTSDDLGAVSDMLKNAGIRLLGIVLNDGILPKQSRRLENCTVGTC